LLFVAVVVLFVMSRTEKTSATQTTSYGTEKEEKLCLLLESIQGVGQTQVFINEQNDAITGVVIVCEGANDIWVKNDILNVVSTAFNIEKGIIAIYSMK
jgi:hypothetical protein